MQKAKRALLQSIFWHCAIDLCSPKPPAQNFGWKKVNGKWKPHWSDLPVVIDSLRKLISCGCKKRCTGNCKCIQFVGLDCIPSCACYHKGCNKKGDIWSSQTSLVIICFYCLKYDYLLIQLFWFYVWKLMHSIQWMSSGISISSCPWIETYIYIYMLFNTFVDFASYGITYLYHLYALIFYFEGYCSSSMI